MSRTSRIVGFSLPPEISEKLENHAKTTHKTRSELLREMIEGYFNRQSTESSPLPTNTTSTEALLSLSNQTDSDETTFIGLVLLRHPIRRQILICQRTQSDEKVKNLSWSFPGATIESLHVKNTLSNQLIQRIGIKPLQLRAIAARKIPDSPTVEIVAVYFAAKAEITDIKLDKNKYQNYKWIEPTEIYKYFTTSVSDDITTFLNSEF